MLSKIFSNCAAVSLSLNSKSRPCECPPETMFPVGANAGGDMEVVNLNHLTR